MRLPSAARVGRSLPVLACSHHVPGAQVGACTITHNCHVPHFCRCGRGFNHSRVDMVGAVDLCIHAVGVLFARTPEMSTSPSGKCDPYINRVMHLVLCNYQDSVPPLFRVRDSHSGSTRQAAEEACGKTRTGCICTSTHPRLVAPARQAASLHATVLAVFFVQIAAVLHVAEQRLEIVINVLQTGEGPSFCRAGEASANSRRDVSASPSVPTHSNSLLVHDDVGVVLPKREVPTRGAVSCSDTVCVCLCLQDTALLPSVRHVDSGRSCVVSVPEDSVTVRSPKVDALNEMFAGSADADREGAGLGDTSPRFPAGSAGPQR